MKIENVIKKFNKDIIYLCPKCKEQSEINEKSLVCKNNHSYDFSKKGYIHLINNYKATKYNMELFDARQIVFGNDFYKPVLEQLQKIIAKYGGQNILDLGCGEGYYIDGLKRIFPEKYFYGLDNSKEAIELAVKKDKNNPYMLANLSNLPFGENSIDCILNILTPANYDEFFRVLGKEGYLIKIIPGAKYLQEIRSLVGFDSYTNEETVKLIEDNCTILERIIVNNNYQLNYELASNFFKMTPLTFSKEIDENTIRRLKNITIDLEILICKK